MINEIQIYTGSYSKRTSVNYDFNPEKLKIEIDDNKFVSNSNKKHHQFYYDNNRITKSTIVFGTCDVCGKKVEKIFDKRGWIRNEDVLFCSKQCATNYKPVINKIVSKRFGNEGIKKHKEKNIKEKYFLQFNKANNLDAINFIKKYSDFIYSERGISLIKELYINQNKTRKEIQTMVSNDINISNYIDKYDIRKYRITEEHKKKCSIALKNSWNSGNRKPSVNKGGRSKWFTFFDKKGRMHKLQGTYELRFAKILDKSDLDWNSYHKRIKIEEFTYAPDFIVEDKFIDTKANYFYKQGKDKLNKISEYIDLILILTDDLLKIEKNPNILENYIYG